MFPFSGMANPQIVPIGVLPGTVYVPGPMSFGVGGPSMLQPQQSYYYQSVPPNLTPLPTVTLSSLPKITIPLIKPPNPTTTIFVGNITDRASDILVKTVFGKMGNIVSWKRVQGVGGKQQAFGFCEYDHPESTLRAIRLLHNFDLAGKKLVVKVDAKSKEKLKEYRSIKKQEAGISETLLTQSNHEEGETLDDDEMDDEWLDPIIKKKDKSIVDEIKKYIKDNIPALTPADEQLLATKEKLNKTQKLGNIVLDEEKTEVISKEILRFKENNMRDEKYREKIREKGREKREREKMLRGDELPSKHNRTRSPSQRNGGPETETKAADRVAKRSRSRTKSPRASERKRERTRSPTFIDEDKVDRMRKKRLAREMEEEESHERRKLERKLREKEASYQEQLRLWEMRENKKHRDHCKQKEYEDSVKAEEMREAKRLREFLEDYLDERDDTKYYKGSFLARRLKEREKEMEMDLKDRQKEKEEIEELKKKLRMDGHPNFEEEVDKLEKGRSQHLQPQLNLEELEALLAFEAENFKQSPTKPTKNRSGSKRERIGKKREATRSPSLSREKKGRESGSSSPIDCHQISIRSPSLLKEDSRLNNVFVPIADNSENPNQQAEIPTDQMNGNYMDTTDSIPQEHIKPLGFKSISLALSSEKKKGNFETLFGADDESEKRKLPILDLEDRQSKPLTLEEKRQSIKKLIEKIPTTKQQLFAYEIDWEMVDAPLMEKRIRPWINKKIIEYIGEEEPTLVEFISSKLLIKSTPQAILDDILMVLDEEAEVFVVKMWRLLIYEIEAKKAGLVKCE